MKPEPFKITGEGFVCEGGPLSHLSAYGEVHVGQEYLELPYFDGRRTRTATYKRTERKRENLTVFEFVQKG